MGPFWALARLRSAMIGITISGDAYAAIVCTLPASSADAAGIAPDRECRVWLPRAVVIRLSALRGPGETFSDVILRLGSSGESLTLTEAAPSAAGSFTPPSALDARCLMTKRALSHNSKPSIGPLRFEDRVRALAIASCSEIPGTSISTPTTRLACRK
jgi:hypothetical protein